MWAGSERRCGQAGRSGDSCGRLAGDGDLTMRVGTDWSYGGGEGVYTIWCQCGKPRRVVQGSEGCESGEQWGE